MAHEMNFLIATGNDFHGTIKTDIPLGGDALVESACVSAITKNMRIG